MVYTETQSCQRTGFEGKGVTMSVPLFMDSASSQEEGRELFYSEQWKYCALVGDEIIC